MTDIKRNAQALMDEVQKEHPNCDPYTAALLVLDRAIEQHEAFRQEVSDAVTALLDRFLGNGLSQGVINGHLHQFIVRKPDPLVEVIKAMRDEPTPYVNSEVYADRIHKKLDALGFEIREKSK
jgi:hypothetical protein